MKIISGTSNRDLAKKICEYIEIELCNTHVAQFADGEIRVEIHENIRGADVYVVQSISDPVNSNLMELLVITDALKRGSAKRVTAVLPYLGYARQDRKTTSRSPITAKLVANLLTAAGVDRVLTMDLHAGQIQGFFDIPVDTLMARPVMISDIRVKCNPENIMFISPDAGGVARTRDYAKRLESDLAIIDKRRPEAGTSEVMSVVGDVTGKDCIVVDDIIDGGGTLCNATEALLQEGAKSVRAYIAHGVLSGEAVDRINASNLEEVVITDSIKLIKPVETRKLRYLTIGHMFGEAIYRLHTDQSISKLFYD